MRKIESEIFVLMNIEICVGAIIVAVLILLAQSVFLKGIVEFLFNLGGGAAAAIMGTTIGTIISLNKKRTKNTGETGEKEIEAATNNNNLNVQPTFNITQENKPTLVNYAIAAVFCGLTTLGCALMLELIIGFKGYEFMLWAVWLISALAIAGMGVRMQVLLKQNLL